MKRAGGLVTDQDSEEPLSPQLRTVEIDRLFGLFNHEISLENADGITIIYGPNGVGKTWILQILSGLASANFDVLTRTPFEKATLTFSDGTILAVTPSQTQPALEGTEGPDSPEIPRQLLISLIEPGGREYRAEYPGPDTGRTPFSRRELIEYLDLHLPFLVRVGPDTWIDETEGTELTLVDIVRRFGNAFPPALREAFQGVSSEITEFLSSLRIHLIDTERLRRTTDRTLVDAAGHSRARRAPILRPTVELYAEDLSSTLSKYLADYGRTSAQLDRTFPQRALSRAFAITESEEEIRSRYEQLTVLRDRLTRTGILDKSAELPWPDRELNDTEREFLALYLKDMSEKLAVFSPLQARLELLADMLDGRFLYKRMRIDRRRGFMFATHDEDMLSPSVLSSGEQQEVVFAYQLLFMVPENSLVMIDEPEISLHVNWQQKFLRDLVRIREVTKVSFLLATHSPQVIHDRWDLTQRLGGPAAEP